MLLSVRIPRPAQEWNAHDAISETFCSKQNTLFEFHHLGILDHTMLFVVLKAKTFNFCSVSERSGTPDMSLNCQVEI